MPIVKCYRGVMHEVDDIFFVETQNTKCEDCVWKIARICMTADFEVLEGGDKE